MDTVSLTLGAVVARLIARAEDRTVDATVAEVEGALRRLVDSVRTRFRKQGDTEAVEALALVEKAPDSERVIAKLAEAIDRHAADGSWRKQLEGLVAQAKASGVEINNISQVAHGNDTVQVADVHGDISINK